MEMIWTSLRAYPHIRVRLGLGLGFNPYPGKTQPLCGLSWESNVQPTYSLPCRLVQAADCHMQAHATRT